MNKLTIPSHAPLQHPDGRISIAPLVAAPRLLLEAGIDPLPVARSAGLDPDSFSDPTSSLSFAEMGAYLLECVRVTRDDSFALRLGMTQGPSAWSSLGYLVRHSSDVRTALLELGKHMHHLGSTTHATVENGVVRLEHEFLYPLLPGAQQISEGGTGVGVACLRQLCGPAWNPLEVGVARGSSNQLMKWKRCLGAPVRFGATRNYITFSARWLEQTIEDADPHLRRIMHERVAELEASSGSDYTQKVCTVIRACLLAEEHAAEQIARRLAVSPRTLRRHLAEQQTTLQALLDKTRVEMACHLLEHSQAPMTQIADLLGFAHSSAFSRAFQRWAQMTPRQWRTAHGSP